MQAVFEESGYRFEFPAGMNVYKADTNYYHDLPAVDFIAETNANLLFIEIKNPDKHGATQLDQDSFLDDLRHKFYPHKLSDKYKSHLMQKWVTGTIYTKSIICIFILEFSAFTDTERGRLKEKIFNKLPFTLNKPVFGGKKHLERFELLTVDEFKHKYPSINVDPL